MVSREWKVPECGNAVRNEVRMGRAIQGTGRAGGGGGAGRRVANAPQLMM